MTVSMAGGEIAPSCHGRVDLAKYQTALKTCRNWIVQPYGGVKNRTGTKLIAETKTVGQRVRLIPFSFNADQTYVLEFGQGYIRFTRDGAVIADLATATAQNFGTGDGTTTAFQLHGASAHTYLPHTVTSVFVDGVEQAKTAVVNLATQTEAFDHADWTKTNATVTANTVMSPASTLTGDTIDWAHA